MCTYVHMYICIYVCVNIYIYIYIYIHDSGTGSWPLDCTGAQDTRPSYVLTS